MENHRYTSLTDLLDAPQKRAPFVSHGSGCNSVDQSFPTEMFGELYFRERSSRTSSSSSIWDLFRPPLPPPRPLHDNQVQGLNQGTADPDKVLELENGDKSTVEGKEKMCENNCCKYDNSGKLFPPPISALKINRAGKPLVYHEFDAEKIGFVQKVIFLPHEVRAASSGTSGNGRHDFATAAAKEEEKGKSSDEAAEQKVIAKDQEKP